MQRERVVIGPASTLVYTVSGLESASSRSREFCTMSTLSGCCFCGEMKFEVTGAPAAMKG
jgi:hypothetical protein